MRIFEFHSEVCLPASLEAVFSFFSDASNLQTLTPPWLHFQILTPSPVDMKEGTLIDYRLRVRGLPLRWQSEITVWDPPHRFVDIQRRGPYRRWVHAHSFESGEEGTRVSDSVRYAVLGGRLVNSLLVAPDVKKIFAYRESRLRELFAGNSTP